MKKIINGKVYNTETATQRGSWYNGYAHNDMRFKREELYRKRNGEYFLYGEGGALSSYSKPDGDPGWEIIPMTYCEAQSWTEKRLTADEYESIFGEIEESTKKVALSVSVTADVAEIIRRNAQREGLTVSAYIALKCAE